MPKESLIKANTILWIVVLIEALVIGYLLFGRKEEAPLDITPPDPIRIEIVRDSIIRDSIYIVNESIKTEIKYIKEQSKKDRDDIMSANDSVLFDSFSRYIEDYNNK